MYDDDRNPIWDMLAGSLVMAAVTFPFWLGMMSDEQAKVRAADLAKRERAFSQQVIEHVERVTFG